LTLLKNEKKNKKECSTNKSTKRGKEMSKVSLLEFEWQYNGFNAVWATYRGKYFPQDSPLTPDDVFLCRFDGAPKDLKAREIGKLYPQERKTIGQLIENAPEMLKQLTRMSEILEAICPYEFNGQHEYFDQFEDYQEGIENLVEDAKTLIKRVLMD
jgi:hypothetical protein